MNAEKTGGFISLLRKEKGLTQKQLADILGVTDKAISRWETGKNYPDIELLEIISTTFNVTINELLEGKKFPKKNLPVLVSTKLLSRLKAIKKVKRNIA